METCLRYLSVFCLLLLVVGCGSGGESTAPSTSSDTEPAVEYDLPDGANPFEPGALVGKSVASFPDTGLVNQFGDPVSFRTLPKRPVAVSFIYTRCPNPQMCPLITLKMKRLEERLNKQNQPRVDFVLVTLDPEYDTPAVLKEYGDKRNLNYDRFHLWTGNPGTVERLVSKFKIQTIGSDAENMNHNMRLYLLDRNQVVRYYWRGNDWKGTEVASRLRDMRAS